jgi:lycopene cyclase domain-containing protein
MSFYLALDLLIVAFPLALSFDRKVGYFRKWPYVGLAAVLVGAPFITWDSLMTISGAWSFSERYAGSLRIFSLPLGELGFFLAVPFSCLFIFEVVRAYSREHTLPGGRLAWAAAAAAIAAAAILLRSRLYSSTVLAATAVFLLLAVILTPSMLASRRFWLTIALAYVPFLIFNGLLTALPVVIYGEGAILGFRLGTIPVEDFLYSFSLLGLTILAYDLVRRRGATQSPALSR